MDKAVTSEQAYQFMKMLIEVGDKYYIGEDHVVYNPDDAPVGVEVGIPAKRRPIAIFKMGMPSGDYVVLNPFSDVLGKSPERAWFTSVMCAMPGALIKHTILSAIELGVDKKKDGSYKANKFISRWIDKMDKKLYEEADRIRNLDYLSVFYDRSKRIAQLQSEIGTDKAKDMYRAKIRKSSWPILTEMVKALLKIPENRKVEMLKYEATVVAIPKIDAILHLIIEAYSRMADPVEACTGIKIPHKELAEHVKNLEAYRESLRWFASATNTSETTTAPVETEAAPWESAGTVGGMGGIKMPGGGSVAGTGAASTDDAGFTGGGIRMPGVIYNNTAATAASMYDSGMNGFGDMMTGIRMPGMPSMGAGAW